MHISEGVLSPPVLVVGAALTAVGVAMGLKKMDNEKIPRVAVLTAAFLAWLCISKARRKESSQEPGAGREEYWNSGRLE